MDSVNQFKTLLLISTVSCILSYACSSSPLEDSDGLKQTRMKSQSIPSKGYVKETLLENTRKDSIDRINFALDTVQQHLSELNITSRDNKKEIIEMLKNSVEDQNKHFLQLHQNIIYRLQSMILQQNKVLDATLDETSMLEDLSKQQNVSFSGSIQRLANKTVALNQTLENFKVDFSMKDEDLRKQFEEQRQTILKQNASIISLREENEQLQALNKQQQNDYRELLLEKDELKDLLNQINKTFQRNTESLQSRLHNLDQQIISSQTTVKALEMKLNESKISIDGAIQGIRKNQTDHEVSIRNQEQLLNSVSGRISQQDLVISRNNESHWQAIQNLTTEKTRLESKIDVKYTQAQSAINNLQTAHNRDKNQNVNSINQIQSSVRTLSTKVSSGPRYCNCRWTGYVNWWDREARFTVSNGQVLTGMISHHQNHYEDRRFKFYYCSYC